MGEYSSASELEVAFRLFLNFLAGNLVAIFFRLCKAVEYARFVSNQVSSTSELLDCCMCADIPTGLSNMLVSRAATRWYIVIFMLNFLCL